MQNLGLLFDHPPLLIPPKLAQLIGLNEAIVLQQVHYWLVKNQEAGKNFRSGHYWVYNSYPEWQKQFPFWTTTTIKRIFRNLEKQGYIVSTNKFNKLQIDRTKWYRIDYERLRSKETPPLCQNDLTIVSDCIPPRYQVDPTITIDYSETTTKISNKDNGANKFAHRALSFQKFIDRYMKETSEEDKIWSLEERVEAIKYYLETYKEYRGKEHPNLKVFQWTEVLESILSAADCDLDVDDLEKMIDQHFITEYENCDYNILHFVSGAVMDNRYFETRNN